MKSVDLFPLLRWGLPRGSVGKESAPNAGETQVRALGREDSLEKEMATHSNIVPGEFHGQRSQAGYSPWYHKESDTTE